LFEPEAAQPFGHIHTNRPKLASRGNHYNPGAAFFPDGLWPAKIVLATRDGQPVKLGGRAFDVLLAPIEARGAVIDCFGVASIPDCCCMLRSPQLPLPCTQNEAVRVVHARYQLPVQAFRVEA
jgi:hypothetical protein